MPRPDATSQFIAAIQSSYVRPGIFVEVHFTTGPVYVWSGVGSQNWNGNTYTGVGSFGMLSNVEEGSNIQARGIMLTLSGIDSTLLGDVLNDYRQGLPAVVSLGLFDSTGALIPNPICCFSGRTDQPTIEMSGESATLSIACENRLVEMNVSVQRRYTDQDQKLDYPNDRGMEYVSSIQGLTLFWGRHPSSSNNFAAQGYGE